MITRTTSNHDPRRLPGRDTACCPLPVGAYVPERVGQQCHRSSEVRHGLGRLRNKDILQVLQASAGACRAARQEVQLDGHQVLRAELMYLH